MSDNRKYVQSQEFKLAIGVNAGSSAVRVKNFKDIDGTVLTMSRFGTKGFGTLEPNSSREEQISFTGVTDNGDDTYTLTGVSTVAASTAASPAVYTETSGVSKNHVGGAVFIISNTPAHYDSFFNKENDETINGDNTFTGTNTINVSAGGGAARLNVDDASYVQSSNVEYIHKKFADDTYVNVTGDTMSGNLAMGGNKVTGLGTPTNGADAVTKDYADALAIAGAPNASETVKGIVEEATQSQVDAGTAVGETGARLYVNPEKLQQVTNRLNGAFAADAGENITIRDLCFLANKQSKVYIAQYNFNVTETLGATHAWRAQTFTSDAHANTLKKVHLLMDRQGGGSLSGNIVVGLYATSGGTPTGSPLATANIDSSQITTANYPVVADFNDFAITPSTVYAIVFNNTGVTFTGGAVYTLEYNSTSAYSGGQRLTSTDGTTWSTTTTDFKFVVVQGFDANKVFKVRATDTDNISDVFVPNTSKVGFAQATVTAGNTVTVTVDGLVSGFTGLTEGEQYWASTSGGAISATPRGYFAGIAISTTEIQISKGASLGHGVSITESDAYFRVPSDGVVAGNVNQDVNASYSIDITENGMLSGYGLDVPSVAEMPENEKQFVVWGGGSSTGQTGTSFVVKSGQCLIFDNLSSNPDNYLAFYPYL